MKLITGDENDIISSGWDDILRGGAGNDTLMAGAGDDQVFGDDGDDLIIQNGSVINLMMGQEMIHWKLIPVLFNFKWLS